MESVETIALLLGVAWAAGINLYAAVLVLGLLQAGGYASLPAELAILADPMVLVAAGLMYCIEFFADKTPGVDTGWDALHTFIRIPAGALLAAGTVTEVGPAMELAAFLAGGTVAAGSHATKAGSRALINTSPEPFSNWTASLGEDLLVISGLWSALAHPWVFLAGLAVFVVLALWLLPRIWRGLKAVAARLRMLFAGRSEAGASTPAAMQERDPAP